ncbi:MAG TPA: hypothetical protein VFT57_00370 [Gemmatimonadaceae bacterium]|jgi:hypothetical protein|nr:hypothetical protein [Gemmatimonadaceae bacterium]
MTERGECCGWASWGALVGMGDGSVMVDAWEPQDAGVGRAQSESASPGDTSKADARLSGVAARKHSGRRARAELALSRWKLGERNKRG